MVLVAVVAAVVVAVVFLSVAPATISVYEGEFLLMLRAKILMALAMTQ